MASFSLQLWEQQFGKLKSVYESISITKWRFFIIIINIHTIVANK